MSVTFTLNQFAPVAIKGSAVSGYNQNNKDGIVDSASTSLIYGATALKITGSVAGITVYDKAAASDDIVGFATYTRTPSNLRGPNEPVNIAYNNSFMFMECGGTVAAGDLLEIVASGDKVVVSGGTNTVIGRAQAAGVNGDLIPVEITVG